MEQIQPLFTISKENNIKDSPNCSSKKSKGKRAYQHIDLWKRKELIQRVSNKKETMKDCAQRLGINYCTAKHILKVYRKTGSFETDLMRKKKEKDEELRQKVLNDAQFADYAMAEFGYSLEQHKTVSSNQSSTKEIMEIKNEDSYSSSTHHNTTEHSSEVHNSSKTLPSLPEQCFSPTFLFEKPVLQFPCMQMSPDAGLNNVCSFLGDLIYAKHSQ